MIGSYNPGFGSLKQNPKNQIGTNFNDISAGLRMNLGGNPSFSQ